jgi:hypothetical protein
LRSPRLRPLRRRRSIRLRGTYFLIFSKVLSSVQRLQLDKALTQVEKGGSRHIFIAPNVVWILDQSTLDLDTVLG